MSKKYRKKPVVIDAIEYTPYAPTVLAWIDANVKDYCFDAEYLMINTLEGRMKTDPGDFIIKGVKGECYPCKPDIFHISYEEETQ